MINDRGEVGGSVELHRLQALVVGFQNALDAVAVRVIHIAVLGGEKDSEERKSKSHFSFKILIIVGV